MAQRQVKLPSVAPGVNNRLEPTNLETTLSGGVAARYLYGADNVDLNEKGYAKRRTGTTVQIAGNAHSVWCPTPFTTGYGVINNTLCRLTDSGTGISTTSIRTGMPQIPVSYSRGHDGDVYWSNGQVLRRISGGVDKPVQTELPAQPPITSIVSGGLVAGRYMVCYTVSGVDGESAATTVLHLKVPAGSGIAWSASASVNVYMSGPNGEVLTLQTTGTGGTVATHTETGQQCETILLSPMPPGTIVRHYNGRMLVASGNTLYVSEPYLYGLYKPRANYFQFSMPITLIEPMDNGVYIAAERTYWIGDLFSDVLQELLPYGAVPQSSGRPPGDETVFWQSTRGGLIVAGKNMDLKNVQEDALQFGDAASGASIYRQHDGMNHVVATSQGNSPNLLQATSYMEAQVIRKGTIL